MVVANCARVVSYSVRCKTKAVRHQVMEIVVFEALGNFSDILAVLKTLQLQTLRNSKHLCSMSSYYLECSLKLRVRQTYLVPSL